MSGLYNNLFSSGKDNIEQIADNLYIFNLTLDNGKSKVKIKFSAIQELTIIDDLRYFYVYGTFTINYNNDILESFESLGDAGGYNTTNSIAYQFRGDGRDTLEIDIMPQIKEQSELEVTATESDRKKFNIKHLCSIYKYEDLTTGQGQKTRKFYFWDQDYQYMSELNLGYSTGTKKKSERKMFTYNTGEKVEIAKSNDDNEDYTGNIIKDILEEAINKKAGKTFKKGEWDTGSTKYNYSSPSHYTSLADIEFVLALHTSDKANNNMPCILKKQRYTDKYELKPLNKYYKSSISIGGLIGGSLSDSTEKFYIGKVDPTIGGVGGRSSSDSNTYVTDYNLINDYTFKRVDATDLQNFMTNNVVYTYDPRGYFIADVKDNTIKSANKLYNNSFVSEGVNNLPKNKLREDYKNIKHNNMAFSLDPNQRKNKGANEGLLNMFFKNTSITFRARGNTFRKTGIFIEVKRRDANISNTYDNTVLGKYLVTYVRHEFKTGSYSNVIHGVKPSDTKSPNLPEVT